MNGSESPESRRDLTPTTAGDLKIPFIDVPGWVHRDIPEVMEGAFSSKMKHQIYHGEGEGHVDIGPILLKSNASA